MGFKAKPAPSFRGKIIEPRSANPDLGASDTYLVSQPSRNSSSDQV